MVPSVALLFMLPSLTIAYTMPPNRPAQRDTVYAGRMEVPRLGVPDQHSTSTLRRLPMSPRARAMRILFLTNAHNGMSQALYLNLTEQGHQVTLRVFPWLSAGQELFITSRMEWGLVRLFSYPRGSSRIRAGGVRSLTGRVTEIFESHGPGRAGSR